MAMIQSSIDVAKKVGNKREKVGEVVIYIPDLAEFGITDAVVKSTEDGIPIYEKEEHNFLLDAITQQVKMQARNRLKEGTAEVKEGSKIAETLAELMAESERGGNAEYLKLITELKKKFGIWVQTLGKSTAAQTTLVTLFKNKEALALQSPANKEKFKAYVLNFAATLEADELSKAQRYLDALIAATESEGEADDF
jgi:hypothetical protein